jgi:hypothetical protein
MKKASIPGARAKTLAARRRSVKVPIEMLEWQPATVDFADGPSPGDATDQSKLTAGTTIQGAANVFMRECQGGDEYRNNCAHFLSNAFISAGFSELRKANACVHARCETSAKRPIRARDIWCWFKKKATARGSRVERDTGFWAVFQLDESQYWGGHVVIIDTATWKYYGTGWYDDWQQHSYKW